MLKKLISVFLTVTILLSISIPSFATANTNQVDSRIVYTENEGILVSTVKLTDNVTLKTEDYANGDALVTQYDGKKIVSIAYVNRNEQIITYTKYEDSNSISTETISSPSAKSIRSVAAQSGLIQLGSIKYYYESSATYPVKGTRLMNVQYTMRSDDYSTYDLYGEWKDLAFFTGIVTSLLNLPAAIAASVVGTFLTISGIVISTGSFVVPPGSKLYSSEITYDWYLQDDTSPNTATMVRGTKYTITHPGHEGEIYYDGRFYEPTQFKNRNNTLALDFYNYLYGYSYIVTIKQWIMG